MSLNENLTVTANPQGGATATDENLNAALDAAFNDAAARLGDQPEAEQVDADTSAAETEDVARTDEADAGDPKEPEVEAEAETEATPEEREKGYLRESDYRKKTMELAEQRKAVEADRAEFSKQLEATKSHWIAQSQAIERMVLEHDPVFAEYNEAQKNWAEFAQNDPGRAVALEAAVKEKIGKLQQMKAQREELQKKEVAEFVTIQHNQLLEKVPEFRDVAKFNDIATRIGAYLKSEGLDDKEIEGLVDHRHFLIADKARRWDEHVKAMKSVQSNKVAPKPVPIVKPGASSGAAKPGPSNAQINKVHRAAAAAGDLRAEMDAVLQMVR
jgi:hypothetical protein